ncbi:MAG: sodium-dependent transporter, partial [Nitrospirae bacterium]|nr:sodium-dependent transporter [Nitrospirota bacterium]
MENKKGREHWGSKIGLILAMAGNAIGLGNFLRFPGKAAGNGGGAFMIPYFLSLILMAIPLMWLEWAQGRYGGMRGHGTTPGIFQSMWRNPLAKYIGVLGIFIPTVIVIYYTYIGSWTLGYSIYSLFDFLPKVDQSILKPGMGPKEISDTILQPFESFRIAYSGKVNGEFIQIKTFTYIIFIFTLILSVWILIKGVSRGIEVLAKIAMPILFILGVILVIRVFTLGHPVSEHYGSINGFAFLWEPKWYIERNGKEVFVLFDVQTWLEAAGQVFFTLSLGMGAIQCYASYLREDDDVVLSGLATTSANEVAEVIMGGSIAIPAAAAFFGVASAQVIASQGSFCLGFTSMPAIFGFLPGGNILGFLWFGLLFLAAITSIVAMAQPMIAFLQDEIGMNREKAAIALGVLWFLSSHICIFLRGGWQVMDFWAGTFGP